MIVVAARWAYIRIPSISLTITKHQVVIKVVRSLQKLLLGVWLSLTRSYIDKSNHPILI